jgi:ABC-type lipoprotein release transport system permease subunit
VRNLLGGGVKTWLRVGVLSLAFITIIAMQGLYQGMNDQATEASVSTELGGGQYWHQKYDPLDPLGLPDAHGTLSDGLSGLVASGAATPILVVQGFLYAGGNLQPILMKGIEPTQRVLSIPSATLADAAGPLPPALIGSRMARDTGLQVGDTATIRWRDARGTFDATEVRVAHIMSTTVMTVDSGQVWLPLSALRAMARMEGEATLVVLGRDTKSIAASGEWLHKDLDFLLSDLRAMVRTKRIGGSIAYIIFLFLAMLAILDTQILSIFHRRKEIGTLMALGVTRGAVIRLFTLEGALNAVLAALAGAVYATPLLFVLARAGIPMLAAVESSGYSLGERLYPTYSAALVFGTAVLVLAVTTIVSYMPTRRIARLKPTDALRGRLT